MYMRCNLGVSFRYGGRQKLWYEGWFEKFHDIYFAQFITRYVLQTCYVDENHHFLT